METLRIALVQDRLQGYGNEARVLAALQEIYPQADLYVGWLAPELMRSLGISHATLHGWGRPHPYRPGAGAMTPLAPETRQKLQFLAQVPLHLSALQGLPGAEDPQRYLALAPYAWEALDFSAYDLVISASGLGLGHAIRTPSHALHLCYCHSPSPHLWQPTPQDNRGWRGWLKLHLRQYDFYAAQRVHRWITTSERVARRIHYFYRRSSEVIPPPVEVLGSGFAGERSYLYVGDLRRSLQVDVLIEVFNRLQRPLQLVGTGPDEPYLRSLGGETIAFLGHPGDVDLDQIYANATAFVCPSYHIDFPGEPIQALGRGVPVIGHAKSGLAEVVLHYRTGLLFPEPNPSSLEAAVLEFERLRFLSQACIDRAMEFVPTTFKAKVEWYVAQAWDEFCKKPQPSNFEP